MTKKTYKKLKRIADYSEKIFAPLNKKYCSNCAWKERAELGRGCCVNCANNNGYFRYPGNSGEIYYKGVDKLQKRYNFDKEYGFFDNINKCCKLPRIRRSYICLGFTCGALCCKVSIENEALARELAETRFHQRHYEYKLGRKLADMVKIRQQHNLVI